MMFLKPGTKSRAVLGRVGLLSAVVVLSSLWTTGDRTAGIAASDEKKPDGKRFDEQVRAFLTKHCQECHRGPKPKGNFNLDKLPEDSGADAAKQQWLRLLEQLKANAMPPKGKPRPPEAEVQALADWVHGRIAAAEAARRKAHGRVVMRRLNRVEYENTVRDLLGIDIDVKESLALDSSA